MTTTAWDEKKKRLAAMPRPTRDLSLCDDADIRDRYQTALRAAEESDTYLQQLKAQDSTDTDTLALVTKQGKTVQAELAAARKAYDAHTVTLTFQAIDRGVLEQLQADHPATEEDEEQGRDFNFATFAPALIAAASVDGMPLEDAVDAMKTWSLADSEDLWNAAWSVQRRKRTDLGKG